MGVGEPALWGNSPYGGTRPQRGIRKGCYGGTRPMGETAPNAVLEKAIEKAIMGETAPNAGYSQGYYGGTRPQRGL